MMETVLLALLGFIVGGAVCRRASTEAADFVIYCLTIVVMAAVLVGGAWLLW